MKKEIADFVSKCLTCQQVKAEHHKPARKIQPLPIPIWKWDKITMDFVTGLARTRRQHDAIWVIVDRLMKFAHFLLVSNDDPLDKLAQLYVEEIVRLHGVPISIVSYSHPDFGPVYRMPWGLDYTLAQLSILKLMVSQRELFRR